MATRNSGDVVGGDTETTAGTSPSGAVSKRPARDRIFESERLKAKLEQRGSLWPDE